MVASLSEDQGEIRLESLSLEEIKAWTTFCKSTEETYDPVAVNISTGRVY